MPILRREEAGARHARYPVHLQRRNDDDSGRSRRVLPCLRGKRPRRGGIETRRRGDAGVQQALSLAATADGSLATYRGILVNNLKELLLVRADDGTTVTGDMRSEEHTSELQSLRHLVCR